MTKTNHLMCLGLMCMAVALGACSTIPEAEKDYTLKTVKMSPAPRDKFYKIVKVPKKNVPPVCQKIPASDAAGCTSKPHQN